MHPTCSLIHATKWGAVTSVSSNKLVAEPRFHNPDLLVWLLGCAKEVAVVVEGIETMAMVVTGSHTSALTEIFCMEMGLRILPLGDLLGVCCISRERGAF